MNTTTHNSTSEHTQRAGLGLSSTLFMIDAWRVRPSARRALHLLLCLSLTAGFGSAWADELNEFDEGSDGWTMYPATMGRSSETGWINVTNDGEGSLRNSPTGTRYTYYWKLTRDIDLTELTAPSLELKYHFKGHSYDYFRVQVGEEGARRLSDFTTLHEATTASVDPTEVSLDLSAYAGTRVRVQLILRKPYDVVERRVGLYVHRIAVVTPPAEIDLEDREDELRVSAFNVQVFGLSKMDKPEVVEALTQIITRFDLVMVQEVRDISETAIYTLLEQINAVSAHPYSLELSERLGRTTSKEQIAFIYRADKLTFVELGTTPDPEDKFERPPVWARFTHNYSGEALWTLGAHLDPDAVELEIAELYEVFSSHRLDAPEGEVALVMGDFNAGCRYLNEEQLAATTLLNSTTLNSLIGDEVDTTTTSTFCPYDRMLVTDEWSDRVTESGVYQYDQVFGLTGELTRAISDHYPVWARFDFSNTGGEMTGGEAMAGEAMAGE